MVRCLYKIIDALVLGIGILALLLLILPVSNVDWWNMAQHFVFRVAGYCGLFYVLGILLFRIYNRIAYDWYLVHENILRKVVCIILLMPFTLGTMIQDVSCFNTFLQISSTRDLLSYTPSNPSIFQVVYYHFVDTGKQHLTSSSSGQFWATIITLLGFVLLNSLLISSIVNVLDKRKERWLNGTLRYTRCALRHHGFAVVIGANEITPAVIHTLLTPYKKGYINNKTEGSNQYVLLQTQRNAQDVREELLSYISEKELRKVIIYTALRDSIAELKHLHLADCTEIYVLGESTRDTTSESSHDAMNLHCVNLISEILQQRKHCKSFHRKVCKVMFEYQTTSSVFQFSDVTDAVKETLIFIPFNRYEAWAHRVLVDGYATLNDNTTIIYTPLDGQGIKIDSPQFVHLVIVGMSEMGVAMGIQAMRQAHYVNEKRTRITFIDTQADTEMLRFKSRYETLFQLIRHRYLDSLGTTEWIDPMEDEHSKWKHLSHDGKNFIDTEIEFIKGHLSDEHVRGYLCEMTQDTDSLLTVAICLTQTHQAIEASLYMPIGVYEKAQEIWVYQADSADIIQNLYFVRERNTRYEKLRPFGMYYAEYMTDRMQYLKALLVNGTYSAQISDNIDMADKRSYTELRDSWKKLTIDKMLSNRYFVDSIYQKLRSSSEPVSDDYAEHLARCEHNRWNMQQLLSGYNPCDKALYQMFCSLNQTPTEAAKELFYQQKKIYKDGAYHIHPNICSYELLDAVDTEAKSYDAMLNNMIPTIVRLVDQHPSIYNKQKK